MPDSPNHSPAPADKGTPVHDTADKGCLLMLFLLLIGVFLFPAIMLLGGSPVIVPIMTAFLLALATPFLNPAERMNDRAKWTGRILTWLGLVLLFAGAAVATYYFLFPRKPF
jgi:hypothetical protein